MKRTPLTSESIDTATARRLAVLAGVDPRTILRVARGQRVRGMARERALRALRDAGYLTD